MSERRRTRDLLLEYHTDIVPPKPRAAGLGVVYPWFLRDIIPEGKPNLPPAPEGAVLPTVYPWETYEMTLVVDQLYAFAAASGYTGSKNEFKMYFGSYLENNRPEIIFSKYNKFPNPGNKTQLFFDLDEKILYYWDNEYIPVNAMLIANTILEGGEA
jgi:hypothetical protein